MRYLTARKRDIANGPGTRVSIWVTGCNRHCPNCFNPEAWDFNAGKELTEESISKLIEFSKAPNIEGFSILGGEPLDQGPDMLHFLNRLRYESDNKSIWLWSGYVYEELSTEQLEILEYVDVLIDGAFVNSLKDPTLRFRGSSNQRIIDVPQTLASKHICLNQRYM